MAGAKGRASERPACVSSVTRSGCPARRSEEHTSELQSLTNLVCRLLLEKKNNSDRSWNQNYETSTSYTIRQSPSPITSPVQSTSDPPIPSTSYQVLSCFA